MDYNTMLTLFIAGLLGQLAHGFKEADKRNKDQKAKSPELPKYTIKSYFSDEINSVMMVIICLIVLAYYSCDVKQIKELPTYGIGPLYFGLGYMGDSAFPSLLDLINVAVNKFKSTFSK